MHRSVVFDLNVIMYILTITLFVIFCDIPGAYDIIAVPLGFYSGV